MPYKTKIQKQTYQSAYLKKYRLLNQERIREWRREWRKNNIEKERAYQAEYRRNYRVLHPEKVKAKDQMYGKSKRLRFKKALREKRIEMGGCCLDCGFNTHLDILHFHHLGDKTIEVTRARSIKEMISEAQKCILLCPNCHAIRHLTKNND